MPFDSATELASRLKRFDARIRALETMWRSNPATLGQTFAVNATGFNLQTGGTPRFYVAANQALVRFDADTGSLLLGLNHLWHGTAATSQRSLADGVYDMTKLRYFGRVITLADIADPSDLDLRRYGPEQVNGHTSYPYIGDRHDLGEHGTWEDLTGLESGALIGQVRWTPSRCPLDGDPDTPGGAAVESGAVLAGQTSERPRLLTPTQMAVGCRVYVSVVPNGTQDKIEQFRIENNGHIQIGEKSADAGDNGAMLQVRTHEGRNAVTRLTMSGTPTGGTFPLTYYPFPTSITDVPVPQTTSGIAYNTTAGTLQTALEALPGIAPGDVTVSGGPFPGSFIDVEYTGTLGLHRQLKFEVLDNHDLTGDVNPRVLTSEQVAGVDSQLANRIFQFRGTPGQTTDYGRILDGAGNPVWTLDSTGAMIVPGQITASGVFRHTGSTAGFFGGSAVTQRAAYTQTFSTADRTHAARAASALGDSTSGTPAGTVAAITTLGATPATVQILRDDMQARIAEIRNALASIIAAVNNNRTDSLDSASALNAVIDDLQALSLAG